MITKIIRIFREFAYGIIPMRLYKLNEYITEPLVFTQKEGLMKKISMELLTTPGGMFLVSPSFIINSTVCEVYK